MTNDVMVPDINDLPWLLLLQELGIYQLLLQHSEALKGQRQ